MNESRMNRDHLVGAEAILPFAEVAGGRIVHVRDVANGKRCGCVCPECRGPLVANQGRKRAWHFSHHSGSGCNPKVALETALHRFAKQVIQERGEIRLPPVIADVGGAKVEIHPGGIFWPTSVVQEVSVAGMRPDIVARREDRTLFVEVAVWHKVGRDKQALIEARRQATIEIDLNDCRHETNVATLERLILHEAPREWLFNATKHDREEPARKAEAAARVAKHEMIALRILKELEKPAVSQLPPSSPWAQHIKVVESAGFRDAIGIPIEGDGVFLVAPRIWQAAVLARTLWVDVQLSSLIDFGLDGASGSVVRPVIAAISRDKDTNWELVERAIGGRVRPPDLVLRSYLQEMVDRGVLVRSKAGKFSRSEQTRERIRLAVQQSYAAVQAVTAALSKPRPLSWNKGATRRRL